MQNPWRVTRAVFRLARAVALLLRMSLQMRVRFAGLPIQAQRARVRRWSTQMLHALGMELEIVGATAVHPGPKLMVGNHVSWLDIAAINTAQPSRFVSKAEVAQWPVVGSMVTLGGTVYLQRASRRDAKRVIDDIADLMREGHCAAVFPEGTTGDGQRLLPFHANLLQAAIDADVPVQPVAIRYADAHHAISPAPAYTGDTSLAQSLWRVAMSDGLKVTVTVLPALRVTHTDRRALARLLGQQLADALGVPDPSAGHGGPSGSHA